MSDSSQDFDPIWEEIYADGRHLNKYPFNNVPSYFFRYRPRNTTPRVLEVGFGAGNNLWMCACEGAEVAGVDAAPSGVKFANERFAAEGLSGDLRVGDFCDLPFEDESFDMVMNRQALTQVSHSRSKVAVTEILRCLKPGGTFWSNMFSDRTHFKGRSLGDGLWTDITEGKLQQVGQTSFHSEEDLRAMYSYAWDILEVNHVTTDDVQADGHVIPYCEWMCTARKKA
ncbi:MAG: class I SAM-dependent methyltransferase [Tateyamaria sp.]|uniref:class I SAM-dependent methyltransferase n=1 Tax=Tateyamaria sp. TaxID=1929288 RepID=UPI003287CE76